MFIKSAGKASMAIEVLYNYLALSERRESNPRHELGKLG
jgi:hypothetical protein